MSKDFFSLVMVRASRFFFFFAIGLVSAPVLADAGQINASESDFKRTVNEADKPLAEQKILPWARADKVLRDALNRVGANGDFDPNKRVDWGIVPNFSYSSEQELALGVVAFGLFLADEESRRVENVKPSQIVFKTFASTNGAKEIGAGLRTLFKADTYRLYVDMEYSDTPEVFYGLSIEPSRDEANELLYDHQGQNLRAHGLKRVFGDTFMGLGVRYHKNQSDSFRGPNPGLATLLTDSTSVGVSAQVLRDTRDHQDNPTKGSVLQFDYTTFTESLGSNTDFDQLQFRYSGYRPLQTFLAKPEATLAWQVQGLLSEGEVPWDRLTLLGGSRQLRGYERGRYRGRQKVLAQIELRQPIVGRHSMVTWAGIGTLSDEISELGRERWWPSVGVGYRLRLKEKINLRFDLGFGRDDRGVYVGVNEAF
jgi:outer membrane protein assembly factor BamA